MTEDFATAWGRADRELPGHRRRTGRRRRAVLQYLRMGQPVRRSRGRTPFDLASEPLDQLPGADLYENAAAATQNSVAGG